MCPVSWFSSLAGLASGSRGGVAQPLRLRRPHAPAGASSTSSCLGEASRRRRAVADPRGPQSALRPEPSRPGRTRSGPRDRVAAALRRNAAFQDGSVSTFVKRGPGRAGLVLRLSDAKNYLLLLADTRYRRAGPLELPRRQGVGARTRPGAFERGWEKIGAKLDGASVTVSVNDKKIFDAKDPKPASGRAGVATTGPGEASFDEFLIELATDAAATRRARSRRRSGSGRPRPSG